jgi:hypothetical protein
MPDDKPPVKIDPSLELDELIARHGIAGAVDALANRYFEQRWAKIFPLTAPSAEALAPRVAARKA